ncbi:HAL/PAL/TAL family ammonia-lyase [Raineya orbicola]|jgi:histidine ammonia-lyase|uniref:Histidine ammonia-lyase n=1 Tax=Raineya orbicola TaxID=2016530 RepID=A0A2N3IE54_9BACT|nr:aromatic amino acid lyase [Raineya orbicola]PKQ68579.1 Histidine ammonia-lyase [Raineya orbicola]
MKNNAVVLNGNKLSLNEVIQVAWQGAEVKIANECYAKIQKSRDFIHKQVSEKKIIYGVTTGFGANASKVIEDYEIAKKLQKNLLLSHACGVGKPFSSEIVRAIMLIRLNTLLAGYSGVKVETINLLAHLLNLRIHPVIPSQGSVGASGDLCPLAHMALVLIGEGFAEVEGQIVSGKEALEKFDLAPLELEHKEGIALLNGTSIMAALGVWAVYQAKDVLYKGLKASCMMFEALGARSQAFDKRLHRARKHREQLKIVQIIHKFTEKSTLLGIESAEVVKFLFDKIQPQLTAEHRREILKKLQDTPHQIAFLRHYLPQEEHLPYAWLSLHKILTFAEKKITPQDAYSVRCTPQVLGACLQAIQHAENIIEAELNAVVDNPLIFAESEAVVSGGNFHGEPLALALDYLKIGVAEMGNLFERQINKLVDEATNDCLPAFLSADTSGLHSGLMIPQYVAASLVSENKVLAHPASVDSIPTCANQEDHVSMGTIAGRQALEIIENARKIVAILMLTAHQALHLRKKQLAHIGFKIKLGKETQKLHKKLDELIGFIEQDRFLHQDIEQILANWEKW